MSDQRDVDSREALAEAFDAETDPLSEHGSTFEKAGIDPFEPFFESVIKGRDIAARTRRNYERVWRQWCEHMDGEGRHPACPNAEHVRSFARHEHHEKENTARTVAEKLRKLNQLYSYWQTDPVFPHSDGFNPFELARTTLDLSYSDPKEPPRLSIADLQSTLESITHIRDYAIVFLQLKLGLRATELCNIELAEVALSDEELNALLPEFGTHDALGDCESALVVPHDRPGNKSQRPRLLPLDEETQEVLGAYLRRRPTVSEPHLFLSKKRRNQLRKQDVNRVWKSAFHPEYAETDERRAVTSHFGRHYFTTYWRVHEDLSQELVKYMRGDTPGSARIEEMGAINEYIHTYFADIEDVYRERIFELKPN